MRRFMCALVVAAAATGCKNQSTGLTNPFLTPDRVPPPSTRVLAPGTAQPYYPGDPMPGAGQAVGPPTIGAPVAVPGTPTYGTPMQGYGAPSQTTPPGGWGGGAYGPTGSVDPVRVMEDQSQLRFAQAEPITPTPESGAVIRAGGESGPQAPMFNAFAGASGPTGSAPRMPIQGMLALGGDQSMGATRMAGQREVSAAEYQAGVGSNGGGAYVQPASSDGSDGFRPQGSVPRNMSQNSAADDQAFRPLAITRAGVTPASDGEKFSASEDYAALRGQLEYWPSTGEWSLRYLPEGAAVDAAGGRVIIENPQVLANLPPGEFVSVRGQLFSQSLEDGTMRGAYRVSGVQRQRQ